MDTSENAVAGGWVPSANHAFMFFAAAVVPCCMSSDAKDDGQEEEEAAWFPPDLIELLIAYQQVRYTLLAVGF